MDSYQTLVALGISVLWFAAVWFGFQVIVGFLQRRALWRLYDSAPAISPVPPFCADTPTIYVPRDFNVEKYSSHAARRDSPVLPRKHTTSGPFRVRKAAEGGFWWAPLAAAALSAGGQAIANRQNKKMASRQMDWQEEQNATGIQTRVADAKAAGVHPLYALQAQLPSFQPVSVFADSAGYSQAGAMVADSLTQYKADRDAKEAESRKNARVNTYPYEVPAPGGGTMMLSEEEYKDHLVMRNAELQNDLVAQQMRESEARIKALDMQRSNERRVGDVEPVKQGAWEYQADQVITSAPGKPGISAAPAGPFYKRYNKRGLEMILPASNDLGESLEPLGQNSFLLGMVIADNIAEYGEGWLAEAAKRYPRIFGGANLPAAPPSDVPVY